MSLGSKAMSVGMSAGSSLLSGAGSMLSTAGAAATGFLGKAWSAVKSKAGSAISYVKELNPLQKISTFAKNNIGKIGSKLSKAARFIPGIGPLIALGSAAYAGVKAREMHKQGKSPRSIAIETIPAAGAAIGGILGGLAGGGIASAVTAVGGGLAGEWIASKFAPEIATALGFTEEKDKIFLENQSKESPKDKKVKWALPSSTPTVEGVGGMAMIKGTEAITATTKFFSENSPASDAARTIGANMIGGINNGITNITNVTKDATAKVEKEIQSVFKTADSGHEQNAWFLKSIGA